MKIYKMLYKKASSLNINHLNYVLNDTLPLKQTYTFNGQIMYTLDRHMNETVWKLIILNRFNLYLKYHIDFDRLINLFFSVNSSWYLYVDQFGKIVNLPIEMQNIESELQNRILITSYETKFNYIYLVIWIVILIILIALKQPILATNVFQIHWL